MRNYRSEIERHIRPALGATKVSRLSARHLDEFYGARKEAGVSPKTIRHEHAILSAALHQAVRWGWVRDNVAERGRPPQMRQRRISAPSVETVRAIVTAAEERDPRLAPMLMLVL